MMINVRAKKYVFNAAVFVILLIALTIINSTECFADFLEEYDDARYLEHCDPAVLAQSYSETCWSCNIVASLMNSLTASATNLASDTTDLGLKILLYGAAIWIAMYTLKNVSSFSANDPSKFLDGLVPFLFKWAFCYVMVAGGIGNLVSWIVNPLLDIGVTIGNHFLGG